MPAVPCEQLPMEERFDSLESVPPEWLWAIDGLRAGEELPADVELPKAGADWANGPAGERLRQRLARHDAQVASALQAALVPSGLSERVLAAVQQELAARPRASSIQTHASADHRERRMTRRAAWAGMAAAVAATVFVAVQFFSPKKSEFTPASLMEAAIARFAAERNEPPDSQDSKTTEPPHDLPISSEILVESARWRWIDDPWLGRRGVAYDVTVGDEAVRATLYVMEGEMEGLISAPPPMPSYPPTQGACAAAWQSGGLVYVLVVEGKEAEYQRFLRHPGGPIA
jgi:hypothetical protein